MGGRGISRRRQDAEIPNSRHPPIQIIPDSRHPSFDSNLLEQSRKQAPIFSIVPQIAGTHLLIAGTHLLEGTEGGQGLGWSWGRKWPGGLEFRGIGLGWAQRRAGPENAGGRREGDGREGDWRADVLAQAPRWGTGASGATCYLPVASCRESLPARRSKRQLGAGRDSSVCGSAPRRRSSPWDSHYNGLSQSTSCSSTPSRTTCSVPLPSR
ncbi:hypothetical protein VN12_01210 [Pirellula sp. SH-Sr6A]|nr:hypothetical protein VN12_01210 [Pirellula sp. SH-Sr6A]